MGGESEKATSNTIQGGADAPAKEKLWFGFHFLFAGKWENRQRWATAKGPAKGSARKDSATE